VEPQPGHSGGPGLAEEGRAHSISPPPDGANGLRRLIPRDLVALQWCPTLLYFRRRGPSIGFAPRHYGPEERLEHEKLLEEARGELAGEHPRCRIVEEPLLDSPAFGVRGMPDLLLDCPGKCIVVEIKTRRAKHGLDKLQLAIYAELAQDTLCTRKQVQALLTAGGTREQIKPHRQSIAQLARRARKILRAHTPPPPTGRKPGACRACLFRNICPYAEERE